MAMAISLGIVVSSGFMFHYLRSIVDRRYNERARAAIEARANDRLHLYFCR